MNIRGLASGLLCAALLCGCAPLEPGQPAKAAGQRRSANDLWLGDWIAQGQPRVSSYLPAGDVGPNNPN